MSKKVQPTPSINLSTPGLPLERTNTDPATARTALSFTLNPKKAADMFFVSSSNEIACAEIIESIVEMASQRHLSNHYDNLAEDYTAHSVWAEMIAVVGQSFVTNDIGLPRELRPQKQRHVDALRTWMPDSAPSRIPADENSRRVMAIRKHYEPPQTTKDDDDLSKTQRSAGAAPNLRHTKSMTQTQRKSTAQLDGTLTAALSSSNTGSRPPSGSSRRTSSDDTAPHGSTGNSTGQGKSVGAAARRVLQNVNVLKGLESLSSTKRQLCETAGASLPINIDSTGSGRRQVPKGDVSPGGKTALQGNRVPPAVSLKQPEQSIVAEELEVLQHQQRIQLIHEQAEENAKKANKISKALADPKVSSKPFVLDANGQVIPVVSVEHLMDGKAGVPAIESPRYQLPSNVAPPPPVVTVQPKRNARLADATPASKPNAKQSASPGKTKDEQFFTSDTSEIPMNIQVTPAGGVACKDQTGPVKRSELKVPSTKMLRSEYMKLVNAFDVNSAANTAPLGTDDFSGDTLAKTAPPISSKGQERPDTERLPGSTTARVPTVPRRVGEKAPNSARKAASSHGTASPASGRPGSVSPTQEGEGGDTYHAQSPALPPQRPKVTDTRPRPHFHAKPTHDAKATINAQRTSATWKETSAKLHSVGVAKVIVRQDLDGAEEDV
jgi:hypothetical protein